MFSQFCVVFRFDVMCCECTLVAVLLSRKTRKYDWCLSFGLHERTHRFICHVAAKNFNFNATSNRFGVFALLIILRCASCRCCCVFTHLVIFVSIHFIGLNHLFQPYAQFLFIALAYQIREFHFKHISARFGKLATIMSFNSIESSVFEVLLLYVWNCCRQWVVPFPFCHLSRSVFFLSLLSSICFRTEKMNSNQKKTKNLCFRVI